MQQSTVFSGYTIKNTQQSHLPLRELNEGKIISGIIYNKINQRGKNRWQWPLQDKHEGSKKRSLYSQDS